MKRISHNITGIGFPAVRNDGQEVQIAIRYEQGDESIWTVPTNQIVSLIDRLVALQIGAEIAQVFVPTDEEERERFHPTPQVHIVDGISFSPQGDGESIDLRIHTKHGKELVLCFPPGQFQSMAKAGAQSDAAAEIPGEQ